MGVSLFSAAATSVSMFKAEPNPILDESGLSIPTERGKRIIKNSIVRSATKNKHK